MKKNYSFKNLILFFSLCIAIIITLDFLLPGKENTEIITSVKKKYEQYYNPGNNHHYSYRLSTKNRNFNISESFAKKASKGEEIKYKTFFIYLISIKLILKIKTEFSGIELLTTEPYPKPEGIMRIPEPPSSILGIPISQPSIT